MTEGFKWSQENRKEIRNKVIKVDRGTRLGLYTVSESMSLGDVDKIWVVESHSNVMAGNLILRAKMKLEERENPSMKSFDEKMMIKQSCWIIEERSGDFFCDCPVGIKGKLCKHSIGMHYRNKTNKIPIASAVISLPLHQKRKPGRPKEKRRPHCLSRSPPKPSTPTHSYQTVQDNHSDIPMIETYSESNTNSVAVELCSICEEEGQIMVAISFCATCKDKLCLVCKDAHRKTRVTKNHSLGQFTYIC